jgi:hypothetical protein
MDDNYKKTGRDGASRATRKDSNWVDVSALRVRVEDEITSLIDHDACDRAIEVEAAEVESMREFHLSWKASKRVGGAHA